MEMLTNPSMQQTLFILMVAGAIFVFALGLSFWIGYTIATVRVEPEADASAPETDADADPT